MKSICTLINVVLFSILFNPANTFGQNIAINTDGSLPNENAMLDVKSTDKGILIPRIDYNNRPVTNVPSGMLIYVIANGPLGDNAYYYYNGTDWLREKNSDDVQSLSLTMDTLWISEGNYVVVGNILNLIGFYKCNTVYTQLATDNNNCGSCGNVCSFPNASSTCINGSCSLSCNPGFGNCDNLSANGCELDLSSNISNCGSCGTICPSGPNSSAICISGICGLVCNPGYADCDGMPGNGCEVDLSSNASNCGNCGIICPSGPNSFATCVSGTCGLVCNTGYGNCDGVSANGCEVDLNSNTSNCGSCGTICPSGPNSNAICIAGTCAIACITGYGDCDNVPANGCEINFNDDPDNCGSCGTTCPSGPNSFAICISGTCAIACNTGYGDCDGDSSNGCEIDLSTNINNCGACGIVCAIGETCVDGVCTPL